MTASSIFSNLVTNDLEETQFIAGTQYTLNCLMYDDVTGSPVDLSTFTTGMNVCEYGHSNYAVIVKSGSISGSSSNQFYVTLEYSDTYLLSGKFQWQPWVRDFNGTYFFPSQGVLTIIPLIRTI
jgi:hypothetical protein